MCPGGATKPTADLQSLLLPRVSAKPVSIPLSLGGRSDLLSLIFHSWYRSSIASGSGWLFKLQCCWELFCRLLTSGRTCWLRSWPPRHCSPGVRWLCRGNAQGAAQLCHLLLQASKDRSRARRATLLVSSSGLAMITNQYSMGYNIAYVSLHCFFFGPPFSLSITSNAIYTVNHFKHNIPGDQSFLLPPSPVLLLLLVLTSLAIPVSAIPIVVLGQFGHLLGQFGHLRH